MHASSEHPKTWTIVVSAILSGFLLLGSAGLALFGATSYNDSYSHNPEQAWGIAALATGGILFFGSCSALLHLLFRKKPIRYIALAFHAMTVAGIIYLGIEGFQSMADAQKRGGDWGGVAVAGSLVFLIAFPAILGLMAVSNGLLLLLWTRSNRG